MEDFSVSQLSALIKKSLENNFGKVYVHGEISGLKVHTSGHVYFSLKDNDAVVDAVCWKYVAMRQKTKLEDGMQVKVFAQVTTYPMRSKYQLIVEEFEATGIGEILKTLQERKEKLASEGLFDVEKKKLIPKMPKVIGVVTSKTGAVISDIIHRISERFPSEIVVCPVLVQGDGAAEQIASGIRIFNEIIGAKRPDVIIVARGGGSFEDLMAFNEEIVVRAAANSSIPLISAVGHETDTTLIDYASDLRAPTPTAAAEMAVPVREILRDEVRSLGQQVCFAAKSVLNQYSLQLGNNSLSIEGYMWQKMQYFDAQSEKFSSGYKKFIYELGHILDTLKLTEPALPCNVLDLLSKAIGYAIEKKMISIKSLFDIVNCNLESGSFSKILQRGFAFVESIDQKCVGSKTEAQVEKCLILNFWDGKVKIIVDSD